MEKKEPRVVSRTMYCSDCHARDRPKKGDWFVVFGGTRLHLLPPKKNHHDAFPGFTPHLVSWESPFDVYADDTVLVTVSCGMHDCGLVVQNLQEYRKDPKVTKAILRLVKERKIYLPFKELFVLDNFWKDTGYEIF